jgi:hypothetical protein
MIIPEATNPAPEVEASASREVEPSVRSLKMAHGRRFRGLDAGEGPCFGG